MVHTLHNLLYLHLEGDDLSDGGLVGVVEVSLESVDGQGAVHDGSHVIILQEYHLVRVLDDRA